VAYIADHAELDALAVDDKSDGFCGIVLDFKRLHAELANFEALATTENPPWDFAFHFILEGLSGKDVGVDGDGAFAQEDIDAARVVAVLMGDEDGIKVIGGNAEHFEAKDELLGAESGIDEDAGVTTLNEGSITTTTASENCHLNHLGGVLSAGMGFSRKIWGRGV